MSTIEELERKFDDGKRIDYEYQAVGVEMQDYYPEKQRGWMWSLFWKYPVDAVRRAHTQAVKRGVHNVAYVNAILKKEALATAGECTEASK